MARSKQKHLIESKSALGVFGVLIGIVLIGQIWQSLPKGTGSAIALLLLALIATVIVILVMRIISRTSARKTLLRKVREMTEQQLDPLLRRRAQLVRLDPYGKPQRDKWEKEIDYFIEQHVQPTLNSCEQLILRRNYIQVAQVIQARVETVQRNHPAFQTFAENMTPSEFETFCAEQLRITGWNARVTMQSRDQGVDVIAEKNRRRVVLQCKLYSRPVGNKAVQEATAAKLHEQAHFGIVVSNHRYTEAAEQLAATNKTLLLHYRDLQKLDEILDAVQIG